MRRGPLVQVGILIAVVALCVSVWVNEGPLWRVVMTKKYLRELVTHSGHPLKGWGWFTKKGAPRSTEVMYFVENGYVYRLSHRRDSVGRTTTWNFDGTVQYQSRSSADGTEQNRSPPWWWGVEDQTEPTAPWWNEKQ